MYTLKQTQQIITKNPYTTNLTEEQQKEILNSKDNTRKFTITTKLNTEDYGQPVIDYNITETILQKGELKWNNTTSKDNKQYKS